MDLYDSACINWTNVAFVKVSKENGRQDRAACQKALKMCTENINLQYKYKFP